MFLRLQEYYITRHADGIIVTAATAIAKLLRVFRSHIIMMEPTGRDGVHSRFIPRCTKRYSIFPSLLHCSLYQPVEGKSTINPAHT